MTYSTSHLKRVRLVAVPRLAAAIGCTPAAVRAQIRRHNVPRCTWKGRKEKGGPCVLVAEYLGRERGIRYTDHQRRNMLRRAGELPPAGP